MISLENQIAVVTGASSGIGKAIASDLAKHNVGLCLVGRNGAALERQKQELMLDSPKVIICEADLCNALDIDTIATTVLNEFGTVHILVHSAGYLSTGDVASATREQLDRHVKINFTAPYFLTQALLPTLKQTQGQIVFINSSAIQRAIPGLAQYSASKSAMKGLADSLRVEINPYGVRVVSVYPGQTATPMQKQLYEEKGREYRSERLLLPEDISEVVMHALTLSKRAEITDIYVRPMKSA